MFYIKDCQGNIIGNHRGYRTMKGAQYAVKRYYETKLWIRFYDLVDSGKVSTNQVYSIGE